MVFLVGSLLLISFSEINNPMRYDRQLIEQGELWRLITANFMHTNWYHLLMNAAGVALLMMLFNRLIAPLWLHFFYWGAVLLNTVLLFFFAPDLHYYVGFSGALHGLVIGLSLATIKQQPLTSSMLLLIFVFKVIHEYYQGASLSLSQLIEAPIATDAHLWGGVSGLILFLSYLLISAFQKNQ